VAAQSQKALQNLRYGMLISNTLSILLRWFHQRGIFTLPFGIAYIFLWISYAVEIFIYYFLSSSGKPTYDANGNLLKSPSVDLANPGFVCEWMFDVLYITWACQIGSALFSEYVWWLYLTIPGYILFKVGPMAYNFLRPSGTPVEDAPAEPVSKRQQKLKARQDRGDPRVKSVNVKR
ncbi:putative opsin, partial [Fomitiporia mediterranea MF3/22]|uniref:putative opsin n=1 Tax=Fomitiporia mediterranea (strain MF3/22) TaxID=694068 RepID=UPI000440960F